MPHSPAPSSPSDAHAPETPSIRVNGERRPLAPGATLRDTLSELGLCEPRGVAVAVNAAVVPRAAWATRILEPGDSLLVIQAAQGG